MSRYDRLVARLTSPEVLTFLTVGGLGYVVDVASFNILRSQPVLSTADPAYARTLAVALAMVVTYLGNRLFTWRGQSTGDRRREIGLFVVFNIIGLGLSVATLMISHDLLGMTSRLADNISANVIGLALGTLFRYWSYKTFVFAVPVRRSAARRYRRTRATTRSGPCGDQVPVGSSSWGRPVIAILTPLLYALGPLGVILVMAVVFAETGLLLGFFLPGDSLLFLAGALVASQVIAIPFWVLAAGVFVAAVAGDQMGYLIGRRYGPRVFSRPDSRFFRQENAERARAFFDRNGAVAVVLGRFVPVVRTFVPVVAGVGRMPRRGFTLFNLVGALVWAIGIVTVGFFFGGIPFVAAHIELITIAIAGVSIVPAGLEVWRRRKASKGPGGRSCRPPWPEQV
ncbi:MAG: GtrA family protein [Marmoricola sp.]